MSGIRSETDLSFKGTGINTLKIPAFDYVK
jgi:hypothetical protein